jgi:hypothetical protein
LLKIKKILIFDTLIDDIENSITTLRSFPDALVTRSLCKSEIAYIEFVVKNQKFVTPYDIVRLYEILNLFDFRNDIVNEPTVNKDGCEVIDNLIMNYSEKILERFRLHAEYNVESVPGCIGTLDIFLVLRDILDEDQVTFTFEAGDEEDIFQKLNSVKLLQSVYDDYFFEYVRLNQTLWNNSKFIDVDLDTMWNLIRYSLDANLLNVTAKKVSKSSVDELKDQLEMTLRDYESKLQNCQSDLETQILNSTIDGIRMQLNELGKEQDKSMTTHVDNRKKIIDRNLKEVFKFYASIQLSYLQHGGNFAGAKDAAGRMSLGEWMKFCGDFGVTKLVENHTNSPDRNADKVAARKRKIQVNYLHKIYKSETKGIYGIDQASFKSILEEVALKYPSCNGSNEQKTTEFFENIELNHPDIKNKMHGLKTAFYFSLPGPNMVAKRVGQDALAEKKAFSVLDKVRIPNGKVNQAVFNRYPFPSNPQGFTRNQ